MQSLSRDHHLHLSTRWSKYDKVPCVWAQAGFEPNFSDYEFNVLAAKLTRYQQDLSHLGISEERGRIKWLTLILKNENDFASLCVKEWFREEHFRARYLQCFKESECLGSSMSLVAFWENILVTRCEWRSIMVWGHCYIAWVLPHWFWDC